MWDSFAGVGAKEIVASTMGVLYSNDDSFAEDNSYNDAEGKYEKLHEQFTADLAQMHGMSQDQVDLLLRSRHIASCYSCCFIFHVLPP
jgi:ferrous iron transport protein B